MTRTAMLKSTKTAKYVGRELELFAMANRWKAYLRERIAPELASEVLEVGAGIGGTTAAYCQGNYKRWLCLEPDPSQAAIIEQEIEAGQLPSCCEVHVGTLADLGDDQFDLILYIDVLEHIEDDQLELQRAADHLTPGGRVVVLSPAHNWLYTSFDQAVGHFRRYDKASMRALDPNGLKLERLDYLDSVGFFASLANRFILRQAMPSPRQIAVWDNWMVPASRVIDPYLQGSWGKSILGIWTKPAI